MFPLPTSTVSSSTVLLMRLRLPSRTSLTLPSSEDQSSFVRLVALSCVLTYLLSVSGLGQDSLQPILLKARTFETAELIKTNILSRTPFSSTFHLSQDREEEARYGAPPQASRGRGGFRGGFAPRGGFGGGFHGHGGYAPPSFPPGAPGCQLYIGNLPYQAGWQELKDLFRTAGNIVRADINMGPDGRPKGSGIVIFDSPQDAQNACQMYNGFDWNGRVIEVREVS